MAKHAGKAKKTFGMILLAVLSFCAGQIVPNFFQDTGSIMLEKSKTRIGEINEEFSAFFAKELSWPYRSCGDHIVTSGEGVSPYEAFSPDATIEDAVLSGRVFPWGRGQLTLLLGVNNPNVSITIVDIKPQVYEYHSFDLEWLVRPIPGGCGGEAYQRSFELTLENGDPYLEDKGIVEGDGQIPSKIQNASLSSRTWTVSQDENSEITITALPIDGYYEFGLTIVYILNGVEGERQIGSRAEPFKIAGGNNEPRLDLMIHEGAGFEPIDAEGGVLGEG